MGNIIPYRFVKKAILTFPRQDMELPFAYHIMDTIRIHPRCINDNPAKKRLRPSLQAISFLLFLYCLYFCIQVKIHSIHRRIFGQSRCQPKGAYNPSRGRIQSSDRFIGQIRLHLQKLFPFQNPKAFHPIFLTSFQQLLQLFPIFYIKAKHQRTISPKREIQLPGKVFHQSVSPQVQSRLFCSRLRIITRMDNTAVRLRRSLANIGSFFQYGNFPVIRRQFPRNRTAAYPGSYNDYIISFHPSFPNGISAPDISPFLFYKKVSSTLHEEPPVLPQSMSFWRKTFLYGKKAGKISACFLSAAF